MLDVAILNHCSYSQSADKKNPQNVKPCVTEPHKNKNAEEYWQLLKPIVPLMF